MERYVRQVLVNIPLIHRRRAKRQLEEILYDMLREYTQGETPTARDVRAVLAEVGDPEDVAADYRVLHQKELAVPQVDVAVLLSYAVRILLIFSLVMVVAGVALFIWGAVNHLMPVLIGVVLSLGVMVAGMFLPMPDDLRAAKRGTRRADDDRIA